MKKPNAKQRAKIYRKAAERIDDHQEMFGCDAIATVISMEFKHRIYDKKALQLSPEFQLFKAEVNESDGGLGWWRTGDKESRVIALLFSEQMALNP